MPSPDQRAPEGAPGQPWHQTDLLFWRLGSKLCTTCFCVTSVRCETQNQSQAAQITDFGARLVRIPAPVRSHQLQNRKQTDLRPLVSPTVLSKSGNTSHNYLPFQTVDSPPLTHTTAQCNHHCHLISYPLAHSNKPARNIP
jgi:hypothetical protein